MAKSIKANFVYNTINVVSGLLFPLITFPYVSRVIMAEGIGQVQFFSAIINYIVLLTSIGIPMYAIREIARVRDDNRELSKTTVEILSLNLILNVIGYIIVVILCLTVAKIQVDIPLFLLLSTSIVLTTIGCPWFYSGIEDFKYITIRGLIIKVISIAFLFTAVKTPDDLMYYGAYSVIANIGNYVLNFFRLKKYVSLRIIDWGLFNPWRHFKPAMAIFVFNIVTSIYCNLDSIMLGALNTTESVGYYTAATRLSHMLVTLVTSLGVVMLPRLSNLVNNGQQQEFYRLANKSYRFILMLSFPICMGLISIAPALIRIFSGDSFRPAIMTLQLMAPIVVAIGISNLIGIQVLYPLGKIKLVTISTCVGAIVNLILNLLLIPVYAQDGAGLATVIAEISVTLTQFIIARRYIPFKLLNKHFFGYLLASLAMMFVILVLNPYLKVDIHKVLVLPVIGALTYAIILICAKDPIVIEMLLLIKNKIRK